MSKTPLSHYPILKRFIIHLSGDLFGELILTE